jgi:aryl-alcohol dehydrogenase
LTSKAKKGASKSAQPKATARSTSYVAPQALGRRPVDGRVAGGTRIRAAVMRRRAKPFTIETLILDPPRADEVLVRMVATGVCHTDIAMRDEKPDSPIPSILGHEGAGVVEQVGTQVRKVKRGDHVVLSLMSCGRCRFCQRGEPCHCEKQWALNFTGMREDGTLSARGSKGDVRNHFFGQSSFATYSIANERNVVKVPKSVPLKLLGPLGCGLLTGAGAVMNSLKIKIGESFACFGAGSVGLAAIMAARIVGATPIIAIDVVEARLRMAKKLGATHVVNSKKQDPLPAIAKITGGRGLDYSLETSGLAPVFDQAVSALGIGGTCGFVTAGVKPARAFDGRAFIAHGKKIMGIIAGDAVPDVFIPQLVEIHRQGRFPFDKLITCYPLRQINRAFADSRRGKTIKPVVILDA